MHLTELFWLRMTALLIVCLLSLEELLVGILFVNLIQIQE